MKKGRWFGAILAFVLVASLLAIGCAKEVAPGEGETKELKTFLVGAFWPMTGAQGYYGGCFSRGAITAIDEINAAGGASGYKLDLRIIDYKNVDVNLCVTGVTKLITIDKTPIMYGSFSATCLASQPICAEAKVPILNAGAYSPKLVNLPYLHTTRMAQQQTLPPMIKYFWDQGARKLATIYLNDPSGRVPAQELVEPTWKEWGGTIVASEPHEPGLTDFGAQLSRIKAGNPDAIVDISTGEDIAHIVLQAREMGLTCPMSTVEWEPKWQELAGKTSKDVYTCYDYFDPEGSHPFTQQFIKAYNAKGWTDKVEFYAANCYEVAYLVKELIARVVAKGGDPLVGAELEEAIWADPHFNSVYGGSMEFKKDGTTVKPMCIFKVVEGVPTIIERVS